MSEEVQEGDIQCGEGGGREEDVFGEVPGWGGRIRCSQTSSPLCS